MKLYRCPHCGKKVFNSSHYSIIRLLSLRPIHAEIPLYESSVMHCPGCTQVSAFFHHNKTYIYLEAAVLLSYLVTFVGAMIAMLYCSTLALLIGSLFLVELCFMVYLKRHRSLIPLHKYNDYYKSALPMSNCQIKVNSVKYLKPYGTYAFKLKETTNDAEFKVAFPDGLIPIQLFQSVTNPLIFSAHILSVSKVPQNILSEGAEFLIEDTDGIFVAKGIFEKLFY